MNSVLVLVQKTETALCVMSRARGRGRWHSRRVKRHLLAIWLVYRIYKRCRAMSRRSVWVRPIFTRRKAQGEYHNLLQEVPIQIQNPIFVIFVCLRKVLIFYSKKVYHQHGHLFYYLIISLYRGDPFSPLRRRYNSATRASICPGERLALTLRYLATGNSLR